MARTKKKRNYKKAPKNTRVFRCVQKVKKKQEIGAAIAICQSSTKQSYRTGRSLKGGNGKKKVKIPKKFLIKNWFRFIKTAWPPKTTF